MAKFGAPLLVDQISGKIGGVVFSGSRSSPTIRVRVKPSNPNSSRQVSVRTSMTNASRAFKGLSSTNAQAWRDYGNTILFPNNVGGSFHPSGINAYTQLATVFLAISPTGTPPTTPPTSVFAGDVITMTGAGASGAVTFTASAQNASGVYVEMLIAPVPVGNRVTRQSDFRIAGYHRFLTGALTQTFVKAPGAYALAYRFVSSVTGERSGIILLGTFSAT